jgi:hypothetical protein
MSKDSEPAITHVLQQDSAVLESLLQKLRYLKDLQTVITQYLDTKLASHCQVANMEMNKLTVITDSALWATQFRFQIPALLTKLHTHPELAILTKIICKIRPAPNKPPTGAPADETKTMPRLSAHTAQMIHQAATTIQHEKLRAILIKIAENTDPDPT